MKLKKILEDLDGLRKVEGKVSIEIKGLSYDSRMVKEGYLFVAIRGSRLDGADFIEDAIHRGAHAVMLELEGDNFFYHRRGPTYICVDDARKALSEASRAFYGDLSSKMRLIGITGTNGKTTTTYLLESLFKTGYGKTGVIGTINYRFEDRIIRALNTTPSSLDLYSLLDSMEREAVKNCIIEVSSHSLVEGRVDTLNFDIAVFTNLTSEHMDYHGSIKNYLASKAKLFTKIKNGGYAVINKDDPYSKKIIEKIASGKRANNIITYGIGEASDVCAKDIKFSLGGLNFKLCLNLDSPRLISFRQHLLKNVSSSNEAGKNFIKIESSLIGSHNVYNILAAASCGIAMGMGLEDIRSGIEKISSLPGRLEKIDCGQDFLVFVDYAHTENGMENVLNALKRLKPKRLMTVFGCGGDRDKSKRPNMGRISSELSDKIFITSDNPRSEDPLDIIREIRKGVSKKKNNYVIEVDRFKAISEALKEARKGDVVLVAGKGHETYQVFKEISIPFDDREVVRKILKGRGLCLQ